MPTRTIYKLIDPFTDDPFYVGQTNDIKRRLSDHLRHSAYQDYPHSKRIKEILEKGKTPILETIEIIEYQPQELLTIRFIHERERYWINEISKSFRLCNISANKSIGFERDCLNCGEPYIAIKPHSKFCCDSCRVMYNRKKPQSTVTPLQMQVLYNNILAAVDSINAKNGQPEAMGAIIQPEQPQELPKQRWLLKSDKEALKRQYVEERKGFTCEEEHREWHKRVDADERLNKEDKIQVKNTH